MRPLEQQTILVTGATNGLGKALARELVERSATVLLHGRSEVRIDAAMSAIGDRDEQAGAKIDLEHGAGVAVRPAHP
jgi:NADP-dependent 3-hydroxy acid dehydrogenase YdfG